MRRMTAHFGVIREGVFPWVLAVATFLLLGVGPCFAGQHGAGDFPYEKFSQNESTARWILAYDWMAWHASDVVLQEPEKQKAMLGPEWFCFESSGTWHAVFGRYEERTGDYHVVFHYTYDQGHRIVRSAEAVERGLRVAYGKALHRSLKNLPESITGAGVQFNTYVRRLEDGRIEVWFLPAWQPDGTLVVGGEARFVLDSTGGDILTRQLNFNRFSAVRPDKSVELNIDRRQNDVPSVGDIFFLLSFRDQFKSVKVWTRCYITTLVARDGHELAWVHAQRQTPDCVAQAKTGKNHVDTE